MAFFMRILVTGASGFVGSRLVQILSEKHDVIALSRNRVENSHKVTWIAGQYHTDDLLKLNEFQFDCVVHLAAVLSGFEDTYTVNTNAFGTWRLLRYCIDRGCKKYILASSIAAVGCLSEAFMPFNIPIREEHPCIPADAYGLSKALMEDIARFFCRSNPDISINILRYGAIQDFTSWRPSADTFFKRPFLELAFVDREDVVEATEAAIDYQKPVGVHVYNVTAPAATCGKPTKDVLISALGKKADDYDFSYFEKEGKEYAPIYTIEKMQSELHFSPKRMPYEKTQ